MSTHTRFGFGERADDARTDERDPELARKRMLERARSASTQTSDDASTEQERQDAHDAARSADGDPWFFSRV